MLDQLEADCHDVMEDAVALWGARDGHEFDGKLLLILLAVIWN